jgi:hypothetical protein
LALAVGVGLVVPSGAQAARIQVGEDSFAEVKLLVQPRVELADPVAADPALDFYLRRARLLLFGSVSKEISFFFETDSPNIGKGGNFSADTFVQDAFVSWTPKRWLTLDFGMLLIPLTHHTIQGATSLNTLDYHTAVVRYPKESTKIWRDTGIAARGLLLDDRVQYRVGVFGGIRRATGRKDAAGLALPDLNPNGVPRFAGNLRFNLLDPEPETFPQGIYLGKKRVVSFGLAADFQPDASAVGGEVNDYFAIGGDLFVDLPVGTGDQEIVAQANVLHYRHGEGSALSGTGFFLEAGYRYGKVEPVVSYEAFLSDADLADFIGAHFGLNYWVLGHQVNVKADLGFEKDQAAQGAARIDDADWATVLTLQTQLYF